VFSHQFGFILLNTGFLGTLLRTVITDKNCGSVLKKLLLADVEYHGLKLIFVTQVGYRYMLDQVTAQNWTFTSGM